MLLWQGFDYAWDGVPHRVSMLAAGLDGAGTRLAALYPGVNGDTARLAQRVTVIEGLPPDVQARPVRVSLGFHDAARSDTRVFRAEGGAEAEEEVEVPDGYTAEVVLQGVEWYPQKEAGLPEGRIAGSAALWPTFLQLQLDLDRRGGRARVVGQAEVVHEAAADRLKPTVPGGIWHRVHLHGLLVTGPPDRLGVRRAVLHGEEDRGRRHAARLEEGVGRAVVGPGVWVPYLRGVRLRLFTAGGHRQGRYLQRIAARVQREAHVDGTVTWRALGGWRGGGVPAPPVAWRQGRLDGGLLGLPQGAVVRDIPQLDVLRFRLRAGSAGRSPREPHLVVDDGCEAARFCAPWDRPLAG